MIKSVAVIGAGINGLLTAFLISENYPNTHLNIYDAEKYPTHATNHRGITHGSRDARHITGSESIGFENSIHKDALRNSPTHNIAGWLLKDGARLTPLEERWREKFEATYLGSDPISELDFAHAELNYQGLAAWESLIKKYPFIEDYVIDHDGVEVYFSNEKDFEDDMVMETEFCQRYFKQGKVKVGQNDAFSKLYCKKLIVPGMSIRIKSLANDLLARLTQNEHVSFHWEQTITTGSQLEEEIIIWTSGVTHAQPTEYYEYDVQGIVGCWVTAPNPGYDRPFKIAAPTPSAYMNFTPDGDDLHVSGGFGWTGEYTDNSVIGEIARPMAEHFVDQINQYLNASVTAGQVDHCVRPSTPTGQPLLLTKRTDGKLNVYITGSAKSGTTHAPVLSKYVLEQIERSL